MKRLRISIILTALLAFWAYDFSGRALADDFIDGILAYDNGDYEKALTHLEKSAKSGNSRAQFWLGSFYEEGKIVRRDYEVAIKWYGNSARAGEADAQFNLAVMYQLGQGVTKSNNETIYWLNSAAEQGHSHAQSYLGSMYLQGVGVRKSYQRALELFRKSAAQCDAVGQDNLGRLYALGTGGRQNDVTAYMWFHIAASQGLGSEHIDGKDMAKEDRQFLSDSLSSQQIRKALELAEPYIKKCLQQRINKL